MRRVQLFDDVENNRNPCLILCKKMFLAGVANKRTLHGKLSFI
jgi:hypothetical protein